MIRHDQPTIFKDKIVAAVSSVEDGAMNFKGFEPSVVRDNRTSFLEPFGIDPLFATLVQVRYEDTTDFTRYKVVGEENAGEGMLEPKSSVVADALVATRPDQALFLPLADCVGAVLYDPANEILMLSHLGRHSTEQGGGVKSVLYLQEEFGCDPRHLLVWFSPAVGKQNYPLYGLGGKGLHEALAEQILGAGVLSSNLEISHVDTSESPDYYSHSEYLKGERPEDGRFAVVAMMIS